MTAEGWGFLALPRTAEKHRLVPERSLCKLDQLSLRLPSQGGGTKGLVLQCQGDKTAPSLPFGFLLLLLGFLLFCDF